MVIRSARHLSRACEFGVSIVSVKGVFLHRLCQFSFMAKRFMQCDMSRRSTASLALSFFLLALIGKLPAQPCSLDSSFNPALNPGAQVYVVTFQTNGQILIGGSFSSIGPSTLLNVARLNQDGSVDTNFNPGTAMDLGYVTALAVQNYGKILVGG